MKKITFFLLVEKNRKCHEKCPSRKSLKNHMGSRKSKFWIFDFCSRFLIVFSFSKNVPEIFSCKSNFLNFEYFLKRLKILTSPSPLVSTKMRLYLGLSKSLAPRGHQKKGNFFLGVPPRGAARCADLRSQAHRHGICARPFCLTGSVSF